MMLESSIKSKRVIFIFLDGVGIGKNDPAANPFFADDFPTLKHLFGGAMPSIGNAHRSSKYYSVVPLDATLDMPGFPQSGTGQSALLTGINAAQHIGKHFGPHPYSSLRPLLKDHNIFRKVHAMGKSALFANAYPQRYFEYIAKKPTFVGANALAWMLSDFRLRNHNDLFDGNALSPDITNERWKDLGYPEILPISPLQAGERLCQFSASHDFVFFEYYQTDKAGHNQSMADAIAALKLIDELLHGIIEHIDLSKTLLLLTSDHGNMEDLSVRTHTLNPVPLLTFGNVNDKIARLKSITDVAPFIIDYLG
jgi:2,3-bisphosphoglycerate-independent phosphoglycerate mutase